MAQITAFGRQRQADLCEFEANLFLQSMFQVPVLLGLLHRETLSLKKIGIKIRNGRIDREHSWFIVFA